MRSSWEISSSPCAVAIGTTRPESLRGAPPGTVVMQSLADFSLGENDRAIVDQLARLYAKQVGPLGQAALDTIDAVEKIRELRSENAPPAGGALYPQSGFGRGMQEIARLIKADLGLVATTIDLDGWDTHFVQAGLIGDLMKHLAEGIDALMTDLGDERSRVTLLAMTEFGRRVAENTSFGTDHGAGSAMFLLGDNITAATGATIHSGWPDLSAANLDEVGDVPAAINYRDVLAPILTSHSPGVDLMRVFPGHTVSPVAKA